MTNDVLIFLIPDLSVDVHHIPRVLKLSDVTVAEQRVLLVRIKQGEVLHNDSWKEINKCECHKMLISNEWKIHQWWIID